MKRIYSLLHVCLCVQLSAQEFPYTLNYIDEAYVEFDDGTDALPEIWDDPTASIPIGFEFDYFGVAVNDFFLTGLGAMISTSDDYYIMQSLFLPYSSDLIDIGEVTGEHTSIISYKTSGMAPNRVFHMQWSDCGFYGEVSDSNSANNQVNFQVRLYEGSNDIAIHFGPNEIEVNDLIHDGNPGPSIGFYANFNLDNSAFEDYWIVGGPTTAPEAAWGDPAFNYDNSFNPLDENPADGTLYHFTTETVGVSSLEGTSVEAFPIPTSDDLNVIIEKAAIGANYEIVNLAGQLVSRGKLKANAQILDVSGLEGGVYFLRGTSGTKTFAKRFVKE